MVYKSSPGRVRMRCMIHEPNPIARRQVQDHTVVYNSTTIENLPESIRRDMVSLDRSPYGIYLKEKYVYRDTFLTIGDESLEPLRKDLLAENGKRLYDDRGLPNFAYIDHQTFVLEGSLFSKRLLKPSQIRDTESHETHDGMSKWKYELTEFPFEHDGHLDDGTGDDTNNHDLIGLGEESFRTNVFDFQERLKRLNDLSYIDERTREENSDETIKGYIEARKKKRFMPLQYATSTNATRQSEEGNTKAVHWKCYKKTPMFQAQDFYVEFVKRAYSADSAGADLPMLPEYSPIDSKYQTPAGQFPRNFGVIEVNSDGSVIDESRETYNLNNQPYYMIEIGKNSEDHHYFIIITHNAYPIFVHVSRSPMLMPATDGNPARVEIPTEPVSRRLSVYRSVSGKELLSKDQLRVTVRNHLGKLIVTFSGHEDKPWIISRTDYIDSNQEEREADDTNVPVSDIIEEQVSMKVPNAPIGIAGGNIKAGFMYGPLHYQPGYTYELPDSPTVYGPVDEREINLWLGERILSNRQNYVNSNRRGQFQKFRYNQDAELYVETIDGGVYVTDRRGIETRYPVKSEGKSTVIQFTQDNERKLLAGEPIRNEQNLQLSYIGILKTTPLYSFDPATAVDNDGDGELDEATTVEGAGDFIKWFGVRYTIRAGDAQLNQPNWRLWNCITPVCNGWKMHIPQDGVGHGKEPVDVSNAVETFSHSWSYSDNAKIEHTANIRFRINLQPPTSLTNNYGNVFSNDPDNSSPVGDGLQDHTAFLSSLSNKMFYVRIYAWWEGGYMDCDYGCPCRQPGGPRTNGFVEDSEKVIFSGFCLSSDIVVSNNTRYMDCKLLDYMKIVEDQYFINSPFYDGVYDYSAIMSIADMTGFSKFPLGSDPYSPTQWINALATEAANPPSDPWIRMYPYTNEILMQQNYVLPSSYDILQNPFMKFADGSKFDEALNRISAISGKVCYFDRFGVMRYDVRPDTLFLTSEGSRSRRPKCNFMTSPRQLNSCANLDVLAFNSYSYKRGVENMFNDLLLVTATPEGSLLVKSDINIPGRYNPDYPGWIGYKKRFWQADGIFGSQEALENIADYYSSLMYKPPIFISWESMGMPHLQAMDLVTFTGLLDDNGFPPQNVENSNLPPRTVTLVLTSVSGEINASKNEWINKYEGEWLYGTV